MESEKHKVGIILYTKYDEEQLYSEYTGEYFKTLNEQFNSVEEAKEWSEKNICLKCHRIKVINLPEYPVWVNNKEGFKSK